MTGKAISKQLSRAVLIVPCFAIVLGGLSLHATPIRPDVRKVLAQPEQPAQQFVPARAGWNGSEMPRTAQNPQNPTLEKLGPAASARDVRKSLVELLIPDPKVVALIVLMILLLRRIGISGKKAVQPPVSPVAVSQQDKEGLKPAA